MADRPGFDPCLITCTARPIADGVRIGHVHLKVADLERALSFYCDVLGFELMQRRGREAAFVSAGGYHHHIALNTWESLGGSPPPAGCDGALSSRHPLPDASAPRRRAAPPDRGRYRARRRQRSRRERGSLSARLRPERWSTLLGPSAGTVARHGRRSAQHGPTSARSKKPRRRALRHLRILWKAWKTAALDPDSGTGRCSVAPSTSRGTDHAADANHAGRDLRCRRRFLRHAGRRQFRSRGRAARAFGASHVPLLESRAPGGIS